MSKVHNILKIHKIKTGIVAMKSKYKWTLEGNVLPIKSLQKYYRDIRTNKKTLALHDPYTLILHSVFQIVVNFMEREKPGERVEWDSNPEHKKAWQALTKAYQYWKHDRAIMQKDIDKARHAWAKTAKHISVPDTNKLDVNGKPLWYNMKIVYIGSKANSQKLWKALQKLEDNFALVEDTILMDIIKYRRMYWI